MKIALVSTHADDSGGVPRYVAALAKALAADHQVTIYAARVEGLSGDGVRHRRVWGIGASGAVFEISMMIASTLTVWMHRLLDREPFDIIHSHMSSPFFSDLFTSHFCELEGIARMRASTGAAPRDSLFQRLRSRFMGWIEGLLFAGANGKPLIVLSAAMKRDFIRHHGVAAERVFVIHSGVDSSRYSPDNVTLYRDEVRYRHSIGKRDFVVLFLGGDWQRKGVAQSIEALSLLAAEEARLLIVGTGNIRAYRRIARDLGVEEKVIFAGFGKEAWMCYAASDLFLMPTTYEPFGLAILEAMASGLPVLVSREAGAAELVEDGSNGLLLKDPRDPSEIASKLGLLLTSGDLRWRLGTNARRTALRYSWDRVARRTVEVYEQVLSEKSQGLGGPDAPGNWGKGADRHAA